MSSGPKYILNVVNSTSSLELFVDELLLTVYGLDKGIITMAGRPSVEEVSMETFSKYVSFISEGTKLLFQNLSLSGTPKQDYTTEMKATATGIEFKFTIGVLTVTEAKFNRSTGIITFASRPEVVTTFPTFYLWFEFLQIFKREILFG